LVNSLPLVIVKRGEAVPVLVHRHQNAVEFQQVVTPFLVEHEAENCLLLGLIETLAQGDSIHRENNYFAALERDGVIAGAALMTPPSGPIISRLDHPALIAALVDDLLLCRQDIPTIFGPAQSSRKFASWWTELTGQSMELVHNQRLFQISAVIPPKPAPGRWRTTTRADLDLLARLIHDFRLEAFEAGAEGSERDIEIVSTRLRGAASGYFIWEDGPVVCVAGYANPTPHGVVIGPVYTPPEHRGRGYASALTAALVQELLDHGRSFACLFTVLDNPIPNHVYRKIGFTPVVDVDQWKFTERS